MSNGLTERTPRWRKSSLSNPSGACVQVAQLDDGEVGLRQSRQPHGPVIVVPGAEFARLLAAIKRGDWDHLTAPPASPEQGRS